MSEDDTTAADKPSDVKASFMGIPLKGWAIAAISLIVVCYAAGHFGVKLYSELQRTKIDKQTLKDVNDNTSQYSNAVTKEMTLHQNDGSGHQILLHHGSDGDTVATFFESDGCIAVARPGVQPSYLPRPQDTVEWLLGPHKKPQVAVPPAALPAAASDSSLGGTTGQAVGTIRRTSRARMLSIHEKPTLVPAQVGCLNPHPWPFRSWWGPANGCWAPMYRQWNDGCTHYQMYNACTGQWDVRISWTYCNPQHHP